MEWNGMEQPAEFQSVMVTRRNHYHAVVSSTPFRCLEGGGDLLALNRALMTNAMLELEAVVL